MTGCFEENKPVIDGPPVVGFLDEGSQAAVWDGDGEEDGSGIHTAEVQLIAPHQGADVQARFEIVDEETDAVEGTHYSLDGQDTVTIPANASLGELDVDILYSDLDPGESRTIYLELVEGLSDGVEIAGNFRTHEITIQGLRAVVETDESGYDFGEVEPASFLNGGEDSTQVVVVSNTGNRTSDVSGFEIDGDGADAFSFEAEDEYTLVPGEEVEFKVTYAPAEEGEYEAELSFVWTNGEAEPAGDEHSVVLTGATPSEEDDDNGNNGNGD